MRARAHTVNSKPPGSVYAWMCRSGIVASVRGDNKKGGHRRRRRTRSSNTWRAESNGLSRSGKQSERPKIGPKKHFKSSLRERDFLHWQQFSRADHYGRVFITLCGEISRRDTRFLPAHWFAVIRTPRTGQWKQPHTPPIESGRERWINYTPIRTLTHRDKCGCVVCSAFI